MSNKPVSTASADLPPFLTFKEVAALRLRKFELQCMQMKLEQMAPNGPSYTGPGLIRQTDNGQLEYKLYARETRSIEQVMQGIAETNSIPQGQILPESLSFSFEAIDLTGRMWTGKDVFPSTHSVPGGTICSGTLYEIQSQRPSNIPTTTTSLSLEICAEVDTPHNATTETDTKVADRSYKSSFRNVLRFNTNDYEFTFRHEDGSLSISILNRQGAFDEGFDRRIIEALTFALAKPITWSVLQQRSPDAWTVAIRSTDPDRMSSQIKPPIGLDDQNWQVFQELFDRYLKYVCAASPGEFLHPFTAQLRAICHASLRTVEAEALTLGVAVESILDHVQPASTGLTDEEKLWIEKARAYFNSWGGPSSVSNRVLGMLARLHEASATTRMRDLVALGAITEEQRKDWDHLRNKYAHGGRIREEYLQQALDIKDSVLVLFYHLIFFAIGYRGKFTDYSQTDWPVREYSPAPPAPSGPKS